MARLSEMTGIKAASVELLHATGIRDVEHLARQDSEFLTEELRKANDSLSIVKRAPAKSTVKKWISNAEDLARLEVEQLAVEFETIAEDEEIPEETSVEDLAPSLLPERNTGNLDARIGELERTRTDVPPTRESPISARILNREQHNLDTSRIRTSNPEPDSKGRRSDKSKNSVQEDRVGLLRAPREETNRGKNPNSRRYVRGVLHSHPWNMRIGALSALLLLINLPLAVIAISLLLLSRENPDSFAWVPKWALVFPLTVPVVGLAYLIWGVSGRCRVCGQQIFVHQRALKHSKSHRFRGLGFVVPMALHLLVFNWFRCSSCGTPVRLKK